MSKITEAKRKHAEFLRSVGYKKQTQLGKCNKFPDLSVRKTLQTSDKIVAGGYKRSIDDYKWRREAAETAATIQEIERKKKQIAPAYNKGAYQYIVEDTDLKALGNKV